MELIVLLVTLLLGLVTGLLFRLASKLVFSKLKPAIGLGVYLFDALLSPEKYE